MASSFNKVNKFVEDLGNGVHNFSSHNLKILLTNTTMSATVGLKSELTDLSTAYGYTAGGNAVTPITSWAQTNGTAILKLPDPTMWTASGGSIGPFQYAVLYNDSPTSPADPIIGYWDYGSPVTLASGETFTVDLDAANGVLSIT